MGNFGKRILIVSIVVIAIVCLILVGNAIQQSEKIHKVNNGKEVVYSLNSDINVTREDLWKSIINTSNSVDTVVDMLNNKLLESVMEDLNAEKLSNKRLQLKYGVSSEEALEKLDPQTKQELEKTYENRLAVLGVTDDEYVKTMASYDEYARSLLENDEDGVVVIGSKTIDLSESALKEEWLKGYNETEALIIRFYSEKDAKDYLEDYNVGTGFAVVEGDGFSELRYYCGDSKYMPVRDAFDEYTLTEDEFGDLVVVPEVVDGHTVPYAYILRDGSGKPIWDSTYNGFVAGQSERTGQNTTTSIAETPTKAGEKYYVIREYTGVGNYNWQAELVKESVEDGDEFKWIDATTVDVIVDEMYLSYDEALEQNDITLFNTAALSSQQIFNYYVDLYNDYYALQNRSAVNSNITEAEVLALITNNDDIKQYGYVIVDGHITKYVGNEEYVVDFENSTGGNLVYKRATANDRNIPNYRITLNEDGTPLMGSNNDFVYELDENGDYQFLGTPIEEATSFEIGVNCIDVAKQELFSLASLLRTESRNELGVNYDELVKSMPALATEIFVSKSGSFFLTAPKEIKEVASDANGNEIVRSNFWYLIYKLTPSDRSAAQWNEDVYKEFKASEIEEYVANQSLVQMALAELRKEAGIRLFDKFYSIDYRNLLLVGNDNSNTYGFNNTTQITEWFDAASYKAGKLAELTKEVTFKANGGKEYKTSKMKITAGDVVDYCLVHSPASYITRAVLEKRLLTMDEFKTIHGATYDKIDYLTSKNWKQTEYRDATENVANNYNYYAQMYAYYGLSFNYESVDEFLYSYGARTYDSLVLSLEKNTMRSVYLADYYLDNFNVNLNEPFTPNANFNALMEDINSISDNYFNALVDHILVYVDFDLDGNIDEYYDQETGKYVVTKLENKPGIENDDWEDILDELYDRITDYIDRDGSMAADNADVLDTLITDFSEASRAKDEYGHYEDIFGKAKDYGICLKHESLGEINSTSMKSYAKGFQTGLWETKAKYDASDKQLREYGLSGTFYDTEFGTHLIVLRKSANYERDFMYTNEDGSLDGYTTAAILNDTKEITPAQVALYIQVTLLSNIFGSTDLPKEKAKLSGFDNYFPEMPNDLYSKISNVYGEYLALVLDTQNTYNSSYIISSEMAENPGNYKNNIDAVVKTYETVIYSDYREVE
ncbi:hypothetical protein J6Y73_04895 [bacterium]|nr:hypothetical protein [bacterium]